MTRIFVGNLPTDIVEKEVENEFAAYGTVNKVEVKHKRDPLSNDIMSTFAFVTITITDSLLNQCLEEFRNEKFRGRFLTVSVARESFMEKLKREREESTQPPPETDKLPVNPKPIVIKNPFRPNAQNTSVRTFDSDNVEPSHETSIVDATDCIKRKSKLFTENGKIKIPSFNDSGTVVQPATKIERKPFDEKSEIADRKRVESLINMKNTYQQQKMAVQQALANAASNTNKKIIFDQPTSDVDIRPTKKSRPLFDEDADDDDDDDVDYAKSFENKKQYEGESGARLQKLQSRFQNDQRFKMNENFLDDDDDAFGDEVEQQVDDANSDERKWQFEMLESVTGKKLQPETKKKSSNQMLRYDPTKNDHEKYEKAAKRKGRHNETEPTVPAKQQKVDDDGGAFQVSKEQFFNVTNQLTSALKPASEGFSLLSMFGRDNDIVDPKPKNPYQEITLSKGQQNVLLNSSFMFHDESSDEEVTMDKRESNRANEPKPKSTKKNPKAEIWHEPFFIFGSDARLQDGLSFFLPISSAPNVADDFESKQKEMRSIIKRKIKKSIKRVLPRGAKPNRKFGRLVRDVA